MSSNANLPKDGNFFGLPLNQKRAIMEPVAAAIKKQNPTIEEIFIDPLFGLFANPDDRSGPDDYKQLVTALAAMCSEADNAAFLEKTFGSGAPAALFNLVSFFNEISLEEVEMWVDFIEATKYPNSIHNDRYEDIIDRYKPHLPANGKEKAPAAAVSHGQADHATKSVPGTTAGNCPGQCPIRRVDQYVSLSPRVFKDLCDGLPDAGFFEVLEDFRKDPEDPESTVYVDIRYEEIGGPYYYMYVKQYERLYTCNSVEELAEFMADFKAFLQQEQSRQPGNQ